MPSSHMDSIIALVHLIDTLSVMQWEGDHTNWQNTQLLETLRQWEMPRIVRLKFHRDDCTLSS